MIAHLTGKLIEKSANRVIIEVHGVGYEVAIPFSTYYELGEAGDPVSLRIYTHVKEDALSLYGFLSADEKALFTRLISVSGIGPKLAVAILSGLPVEEFIDAIREGDVVKLNAIPGVGKKTAERLVLEMKDKVLELFPERDPVALGTVGSLQSDVVSALINLGYPKHSAEKAVSRAIEEDRAAPFEMLLKRSLKRVRAG